jgi:hypothetical protein
LLDRAHGAHFPFQKSLGVAINLLLESCSGAIITSPRD